MTTFYIPLIAAVLFLILWCATSRVFSQFNPWLILQSLYGIAVTDKGKTLRFQSALIDGARYVACLTYVFATDGLYVRQFFPFSFPTRERALFIPWAEIEIKKTDYMTTYSYEIHLQRVPQVDFRVHRRIGKRIIQFQANHIAKKS